jgi:hypothetical protein
MTGIAGYQCAASGRAAEKRDELLPPHKHCPQAEDYTLAYRWARALLCISKMDHFCRRWGQLQPYKVRLSKSALPS